MVDQGVVTDTGDGVAEMENGRASSGRHGRDSLGRLSSPILVGREPERGLLLDAITRPRALILVEGEAGVGKSRLVRETLSDAAVQHRRVLIGHCHRLSEPFLLGPVVEAVRGAGAELPGRPLSPVVGALQPLLPELADVLPPEPPPIGDPRAERHRVFRALRELIAAFGPTVCVLEDLHWADEGTLELLTFLLSEPPEGLALVLTYRGEDLPACSRLVGLAPRLPTETVQATIELSPLAVDEVQRLVCAILEIDEVSQELAKHLHERTAGIPFAVEEVLRLLRDRDQLTIIERLRAADKLHQVGVPPAIQQSIRERMEPFTADARLIARAAAVLSVPASEQLIASVAGLPPVRAQRGLAKTLSAGVLKERMGGLHGFRHALAAQAVYDEIAALDRRRLHLRAAEALEFGPDPRPLAQLAHHYKEAGRPRQWARCTEAAAEAASSVGDDRAAARLLEQALCGPGLSGAARVRMAVKLGPAALYSVAPETAVDPLQRVLDEEPMAVGTRGELRYWISRLRCQTGDAGCWREEMVRAAGELARRPELAARAMVNLAWPVYEEEHFEHQLAWLDRAVEAVAQTDDPAVRTAVHSQRAAILLCVGDPQWRSALGDIPPEGHSVEERLQLLRAYHSLSVMALGLGHHEPAKAFLAEVARLDDLLDHVSWEPWRESTQVALDWRVGRWEGLESRIRELSERTRGRPGVSVANELVLSSLLLSQGRIEEAERSFESILEQAKARHWMTARIRSAAGLARIHLARGDADAASEVAAIGLEVVKQKGIWIWGAEVVPIAVQALLARAENGEACELVERFTEGVAGKDAPAASAASVSCQAALAEARGRHKAAARLFARASRVWAELPSPYAAAEAREAQACCLLAQGEGEGADLLLSALETFEDLGARLDARRVRAALKARDLAPPSPGGRRAYGDELSPREAEVARLAGSGRKNREIADVLFISPRTVEAHVASAIRKLGLESKQELASVAVGDPEEKAS